MKPSESIKILNDLFKQFNMVPTKRVRKLVKILIDENTMIKKDNEQLRKKIRRMRDG